MPDAPHPLSACRAALLLDACGPHTAVGLFQNGTAAALQSSATPSLASLFALSESVLDAAGLSLPQLDAFVYAEGPGSTLGLRLAAMAIRTWQSLRTQAAPAKVFCFNALAFAAAAYDPAFPMCKAQWLAPWRRDTAFCLNPLPPHGVHCLQIADFDPAATPSVLLEIGRPLGNAHPQFAAIERIPYPIDTLARLPALPPSLLRLCHAPQPLQLEAPQFAKWIPDRHRATP